MGCSRFLFGVSLTIATLLVASAAAFGQTFSDMTTATATQILPAIGAKASNGMTSDTGIVIGSVGVPGSCPGSAVDLRDDVEGKLVGHAGTSS